MTSAVDYQSMKTGELIQFPLPNTRTGATVRMVIPCYNEAARLDTSAFIEFLACRGGVDLVFVDDGSRDNTLQVLETIHAAFPERVEVLALKENNGKAEAVRQGLLHATQSGAAFVGYWDADLATPLDAIEDFGRVGERYSDVEVIYGARRMMLGHKVERTIMRRTVSRICATLARIALGLPIGDTQCGAKLLRNSQRLVSALQEPFSAGWLFDVELFVRIAAEIENCRSAFYEYPLAEWTEVAGSKVSGRAIVRSGFSMLRLIAECRLGLTSSIRHLGATGVDVVFASREIAKAA